MLSIFSPTANWQATTVYKEFDIVKASGKTYYALQDHTSAAAFSTDSAKWGGYSADPFGMVLANPDGSNERPHFFFKPSYGSEVGHEPRVKTTRFGEGYEQRIPEAINNDLLNISVPFDVRSAKEATAILHFLKERGGYEPFLFTPPEPYATTKLFKCPNWRNSMNFLNNNTISVEFQEVAL